MVESFAHLEEELGIEIVRAGAVDRVSSEGGDRLVIRPEGQHLDLGPIAERAVKAPGALVTGYGSIVGDGDALHQAHILVRLFERHCTRPNPRNHRTLLLQNLKSAVVAAAAP